MQYQARILQYLFCRKHSSLRFTAIPTYFIPTTERGENIMKWSTPSYQDLRYGFEINLYINNR
jgi:coenzyme PQQ precursor peptide PqqA